MPGPRRSERLDRRQPAQRAPVPAACSRSSGGTHERPQRQDPIWDLFETGGGSEAGFGQAKMFSEAGCEVMIADVRQDHLDQALAY